MLTRSSISGNSLGDSKSSAFTSFSKGFGGVSFLEVFISSSSEEIDI